VVMLTGEVVELKNEFFRNPNFYPKAKVKG